MDLYKEIASEVFDKPLQEITPEERAIVKHAAYMVVYSMEAPTLSKEQIKQRVKTILERRYVEDKVPTPDTQ